MREHVENHGKIYPARTQRDCVVTGVRPKASSFGGGVVLFERQTTHIAKIGGTYRNPEALRIFDERLGACYPGLRLSSISERLPRFQWCWISAFDLLCESAFAGYHHTEPNEAVKYESGSEEMRQKQQRRYSVRSLRPIGTSWRPSYYGRTSTTTGDGWHMAEK